MEDNYPRSRETLENLGSSRSPAFKR